MRTRMQRRPMGPRSDELAFGESGLERSEGDDVARHDIGTSRYVTGLSTASAHA